MTAPTDGNTSPSGGDGSSSDLSAGDGVGAILGKRQERGSGDEGDDVGSSSSLSGQLDPANWWSDLKRNGKSDDGSGASDSSGSHARGESTPHDDAVGVPRGAPRHRSTVRAAARAAAARAAAARGAAAARAAAARTAAARTAARGGLAAQGLGSPLSDKSSSNSCLSAGDILQLGDGLLDHV